jgi:hypothetical protein
MAEELMDRNFLSEDNDGDLENEPALKADAEPAESNSSVSEESSSPFIETTTDEMNTAESESASDTLPEAEEVSDRPVAKVAVDWVELEGALENNSPELHSFLNTVTGDVIRIFEGGEKSETRLKQVEASMDYLYIEPVSSREQYRWMEEFIEIVEEPTLKDKLNIAIDGKGAFRRFKDVLVGYPDERERWFTKRSAQLRQHMTTWLGSKNVFPTNLTPWEEGEDYEPRQKQSEDGEESGSRESEGTDLRTTARELLDLIPSRELPTAVAFLEFLRTRRGYRRNRFS